MLKDFHDTAVTTSDDVDHTLFTHLNPQQPSNNDLIDEFRAEWEARKKARGPKRPRLSVAPRNVDLDADPIEWCQFVDIPDTQPFM